MTPARLPIPSILSILSIGVNTPTPVAASAAAHSGNPRPAGAEPAGRRGADFEVSKGGAVKWPWALIDISIGVAAGPAEPADAGGARVHQERGAAGLVGGLAAGGLDRKIQ